MYKRYDSSGILRELHTKQDRDRLDAAEAQSCKHYAEEAVAVVGVILK